MLLLILKCLKFLAFLLAVLWFAGCASDRIVYKNVYIPQKCDITTPQRPQFDANTTSQRVIDLIIYTEKLENSLNYCTQD